MQMNTRFLKNTEQKATKHHQHPAPRIYKRAFPSVCPTFYGPPDPLSGEGVPFLLGNRTWQDYLDAGSTWHALLALTPDAGSRGSTLCSQ